MENFLVFILMSQLVLFNSCKDDETKEIYLEGEPIPGIEIVFPLGYFSGEPMMPKISPDGRKLLFTGPSELPQWKGLWVMDLDTQQKTLLHPDGRNADWAPDSEWMVFNVGAEIFKMKTDGTGSAKLINGAGFFEPSWSPNDNIIYFGGNQGAGIINVDGSDLLIVPELGGQGSWHPTERRIISSKGYSATSAWRKFPVYDLNNEQIEITYDAVVEESNEFPKYSKNALQISFSNGRGIYMMDLDGSYKVERILPNHLQNSNKRGVAIRLYCAYPSWYPNGNDIIYEHFEITKSDETSFGRRVEGIIRFYKVSASEAMNVSNLKEK